MSDESSNEITLETVCRVAKLAHIQIDNQEAGPLAHELGAILRHIRKIDVLALNDVPTTTHAMARGCPLDPDVPQESLPAEQALRNAPAREKTAFKVPKIIESA